MHRQVTAEELEYLYLLIGKGIWHLQYVEDGVSGEEAKALLAKQRRNTLGTSLKIAREKKLIEDVLLGRPSEFKEECDWLVHRSQCSHGDLLYTDRGRAETFTRLEAFTNEAHRLQAALLGDINQYLIAIGIDTAAAQRFASQNTGRLRSEG
ncbi:hypothetical protein [Azohydromonas aeria]|uniref:hypothetical protein n=1 Tax=Azohydromonas aeria TaxID=2590212 RepID=UPI0012F7BF15|nr:hypothetical protein [Azohydromonas aeria]